MEWSVGLQDEFDPEFGELPEAVQDEILALMGLLKQFGPALGRPRVDTLNGSRHANMKELRFERRGWSLARRLCVRPEAAGDSARRRRQVGRQ
jgi:hypothetical protein